MFMRVTRDRTHRPNSLNGFGIASDSNAIVSLS